MAVPRLSLPNRPRDTRSVLAASFPRETPFASPQPLDQQLRVILKETLHRLLAPRGRNHSLQFEDVVDAYVAFPDLEGLQVIGRSIVAFSAYSRLLHVATYPDPFRASWIVRKLS